MKHSATYLSFAACLFAFTALPAKAEEAHGFAVLGKLKYPAGFSHFDYVNPDAPKGGRLTLWYNGSYDSLNPFILKGQPAAGSNPFLPDGTALTFETLLTASADEPDSYYGLIAQTVAISEDRSAMTVKLNPRARFHDGSEITADDVVFSMLTLKEKGHPVYNVLYRDIAEIKKLGPREIRFTFAAEAEKRDLPVSVASLPVLSKAYYTANDFSKTSLKPPLGSGPYRVKELDEGRSITYERVGDHWAKDMGVYRGRYNFDEIRWDYYRDRDIALEALFAGKLDFREEFTSRTWATKYDVPPVNDGRLIREVLPDQSPSGFQAFYFNARKEKFSSPAVRYALSLAFDFEWTNKNLFYSQYERTYSIFQNSELEASDAPSPGERELLEPYRQELPAEVFDAAYRPGKTDGSGQLRQQLREAKKILTDNGWTIQEGQLRNAKGEGFEVEFLSYGKGFERIIAPIVKNLARLGITARFRLVEPAQYQRRLQVYDYDVITIRSSSGLTPGLSLKNRWHSSIADVEGGQNYAGVKSPVVDALIERIMQAGDREELRHATRALDRVIMWNHHVIPQWYKASHNIAYWDKFARPATKPKYALGFLDTWWFDPAKAQ